jgi:hypothetical protein
VSIDSEIREQVWLTADVDGIETNGSNLNQNLVLAYLGGRRFFENDVFPLTIWFEVVGFSSERYEPLGQGFWK